MKLENNRLTVGSLTITLQRTLRLPEDGKTHSLPPGLGSFPMRKIQDYKDKVPAAWRDHGGVFVPMYQREAMWLSFQAAKPCAVKVAAGKVNAVSGQPWNEEIQKPREVAGKDPEQDYMVCQSWGGGQPWLDGFNTGDGVIRQFVAMPLGMGYTVEGQVTGEEKHGGVQLKVFEALPGKIKEPEYTRMRGFASAAGGLESMGGGLESFGVATNSIQKSATRGATRSLSRKGSEMGLAAGGKMKQKIYEDPHGFEVWDQGNTERVFIHIVNSQMWTEITGEPPPATPVSAHTYTQYGYPWYEIYEEDKDDVQGSGTLGNVKPVSEMDADKGFEDQQDDSPLDESKNVKFIGKKPVDPLEVVDGTW